MSGQQPWTGIQIETSFFPLSFILCTPTIIIDGHPTRRAWGRDSFPTTGGLHNVRIYFYYLWMPTCGEASINVVVQPNCVHRIVYEMGPWMLSPGSIRELPLFRFQ
jgi:hypothetical protein